MLGGLVPLVYSLLVLMALLGGFNMILGIRVGNAAKLLHVMEIYIETIAATYFLLIPGVPEGLKSVKSITKFQFIPGSSSSLVYVGGFSSLPTESNDSNNMVSKFSILANEYLPLVPFGGRIVDILYLQPCKGIDMILWFE